MISLTCALVAILLQQWARKYLTATQPCYAPDKLARTRTFLAEGVEELVPWTVEALSTLLHISLFLSFAGLVVFRWDVILTVSQLVLLWISICMTLYGYIAFMPNFRHDTTPLSLPAWHIFTRISFLTFRALRRLALSDYFSDETFSRSDDLARRYGKWLSQGMEKIVEEAASNSPSEINTRALQWTFDGLEGDHQRERFFSGLLGFCSSNLREPLPGLTDEGKQRLFTALTGLLDRTFSSDLLPEHAKYRRAIICMKLIDPINTTEAFRGIDMDKDAILDAQAVTSMVIVRVRSHDDSWYALASESLGVPKAVLQVHATHGDSLSLAILNHVTRQQFSHFRESSWPRHEFSEVVEEASKSNIRDTSPEVRREFCALWNQIVRKARNDNDRWIAFEILRLVRNVFVTLHQGADSATVRFPSSTGDDDAILWEPFLYPVCNIPGHHQDSTPHIHDDFSSTTFARGVPHDHDNTAPVPSFLTTRPHMPSLSAYAPLLVD